MIIKEASFDDHTTRQDWFCAETYLDITAKSCYETVSAALNLVEIVQADAYSLFLSFLKVVDIVPAEQVTEQTHHSK